jgi:sterol desaturase/sphingolipid hydroxylase (fatty acid hydroxylase superfamily)
LNIILSFSLAFLAQVLVVLIVIAHEHFWPAKAKDQSSHVQNLGIGMLGTATDFLAGSWLAPLSTLALNAAGGGYFVLPSAGWGLIVGIAVYVFAMDLGEYLFHRVQHAVPFMWAMHSLHHSDPNFGTTTTIRHFWLESWIKSLTIWLAVGLLLKATPLIVAVYGVISYYNFLTHANLRLNFRGGSWIFISASYHRLHHSSSPEHFDCNFAALLPIFDVMTGAYHRPRDGEYPDTGLNTGTKPDSVLQALVWPVRGLFTTSRREA